LIRYRFARPIDFPQGKLLKHRSSIFHGARGAGDELPASEGKSASFQRWSSFGVAEL